MPCFLTLSSYITCVTSRQSHGPISVVGLGAKTNMSGAWVTVLLIWGVAILCPNWLPTGGIRQIYRQMLPGLLSGKSILECQPWRTTVKTSGPQTLHPRTTERAKQLSVVAMAVMLTRSRPFDRCSALHKSPLRQSGPPACARNEKRP